ncbi:hypothetical protein [Croceicoccus hydrothermalis]|uniref:hypothetical protein n=1 Tax=Croceicoccus hydrothermalis TaxID=2867964 RepID=UPI001EFBFFD5|nr:hypothetical protein [Croceicoccus hydrothermalis]
MRVGSELLANTMDAYRAGDKIFIQLGQLARLLDLSVRVSPDGLSATGDLKPPAAPFAIDVAAMTATIGAQPHHLDSGSVCPFSGDLFLATDLVERVLPMRLRLRPDAQLMEIDPTATLPVMLRRAVEDRRRHLDQKEVKGVYRRIEDPYRAMTAPTVAFAAGMQTGRGFADAMQWVNVQAASDLAFAGFRGAFAANSRGMRTARLFLERVDADNRALGPLGGRRAVLGDVNTPDARLGARNVPERGLFFSTSPLSRFDFSAPVVPEGDLPAGEDVELYVNGVLRASQADEGVGRYRFEGLTLPMGDNLVRLVFYGAQGQMREEVRHVPLGAGQLQPGESVFQLGIAEAFKPVYGFGLANFMHREAGPRVTLGMDYGLTSSFTVHADLTRYDPWGAGARIAAAAGVKTIVARTGLDALVAHDTLGGRAASLLAATRRGSFDLRASHSEYAGGFIDETRGPIGFGLGALRRASELRMGVAAPLPGGMLLPLSFDLRYADFDRDGARFDANIRAGVSLGRAYVNLLLGRQRRSGPVAMERNVAAAEAIVPLAEAVTVRTGLTYRMTDGAGVERAFIASQFRNRFGEFQLGASRYDRGVANTLVDMSHRYRIAGVDITTAGGMELDTGDWRASLQLSFVLAPGGMRDGYRLSSANGAIGGRGAIDAFIDANGDGRRQDDEVGVGSLRIHTPGGIVTTDDAGYAVADMLGDSSPARLRIDASQTDQLYLGGVPDALMLTPRQGRTVPIRIPMSFASEIEIPVFFATSDGFRPIAAILLKLVPLAGEDGAGPVIAARTGHDGIAIFGAVPPGRYTLRLDPDQATRFGLRMAEAPVVEVPASCGYMLLDRAILHIQEGAV